uniref:Microbial-type PARG catalytic domain-containing protein n=1 Tax=Eutreptiella gymnastica TaxID=73025 RepID=A0A7S1NEX5_9EUGL
MFRILLRNCTCAGSCWRWIRRPQPSQMSSVGQAVPPPKRGLKHYSGEARPHYPSTWLEKFKTASSRRDATKLRECRIQIIKQTIEAINQGGYHAEEGTRVDLPTAPQGQSSRVPFAKPDHAPPGLPPRGIETVVEVVEGDCLEAAIQLQAHGLNPVVLNMASPRNPGGGYMNGAGAQEENLFRRSDYCCHLKMKDYPLRDAVIYTSHVNVFRGSEAKGYPFLPDPKRLAFIALAAQPSPRLEKGQGGALRLNGESAARLRRSICTFFNVALEYKHDSMVLSALGCGAFCNPPAHVAEIFAEVLQLPQYEGAFRHVTFAIFDDHNARRAHNPEGNVAPFRRCFMPVPQGHPMAQASDTDLAPGASLAGAPDSLLAPDPGLSRSPPPDLDPASNTAHGTAPAPEGRSGTTPPRKKKPQRLQSSSTGPQQSLSQPTLDHFVVRGGPDC